jgi:hypothetical protein
MNMLSMIIVNKRALEFAMNRIMLLNNIKTKFFKQ